MDSGTLVSLILGLLLFSGGLAVFMKVLRPFGKEAGRGLPNHKEWGYLGGSLGGMALGALLLALALFLGHPEWQGMTAYAGGPYDGMAIAYGGNLAHALSGGFLAIAFLGAAFGALYVIYHKDNLTKGVKRLYWWLFGAGLPLGLLGLVFALTGIGPYLHYPLISGFEFTGSGFFWTTAADMGSYQGLHIAFYALIILGGAGVAYAVSDFAFYQRYHRHGMIDTLVLIAFPAGVIGARLWYVIGNYEREFAGHDFWNVFKIWDGGITILGGAAAGILAGFFFLKLKRKEVDARWAIDVCVPTILLAQVIGRWGNFFNVEVYGQTVSLANGWQWLPNFVALQMGFNSGGSPLAGGRLNTPLFLVEGLLNLAGYFLIVYGVGKGLKKYRKPGDLAGLYFVWYGLVRFVMEPYRNVAFNMGVDNSWSVSNSLAYVVIGLVVIAAFHYYDGYLVHKAKRPLLIALASLPAAALVFPALPSLTVASGDPGSSAYVSRTYGGYELLFTGKSPALLAAWVLLLAAFALFLAACLKAPKIKEKTLWILVGAGASLALVGGLMFLLGAPWNDLGPTFNGAKANYSLSYGFLLPALVALAADYLVLTLLFGDRALQKKAAVLAASQK